MILKTLQWNIGGGKIRNPNADPTKLASHVQEGLDYILERIKSLNPDIITLQETHSNQDYSQAKDLAGKLGFNFVDDVNNHPSHVDANFDLCQSILSRFEINDHEYVQMFNPKFEVVEEESGDTWISFDKGVTSVTVQLPNKSDLCIQTLHGIPLRRFKVSMDDERVQKMLHDVDGKIKSGNVKLLVQGDFNVDSLLLKDVFPQAFSNFLEEVPCQEGTNPKGHKYDHVLFKGLKLIKSEVFNDVLTDHYPVYSEFEV